MEQIDEHESFVPEVIGKRLFANRVKLTGWVKFSGKREKAGRKVAFWGKSVIYGKNGESLSIARLTPADG